MSSAAYDPNKQGWGFASVVVLMTLGLLYTAYSIHSSTYTHPRDPMTVQVYHERDAKGGESHEAAKSGESHEAPAGEAAAAPKAEH